MLLEKEEKLLASPLKEQKLAIKKAFVALRESHAVFCLRLKVSETVGEYFFRIICEKVRKLQYKESKGRKVEMDTESLLKFQGQYIERIFQPMHRKLEASYADVPNFDVLHVYYKDLVINILRVTILFNQHLRAKMAEAAKERIRRVYEEPKDQVHSLIGFNVDQLSQPPLPLLPLQSVALEQFKNAYQPDQNPHLYAAPSTSDRKASDRVQKTTPALNETKKETDYSTIPLNQLEITIETVYIVIKHYCNALSFSGTKKEIDSLLENLALGIVKELIMYDSEKSEGRLQEYLLSALGLDHFDEVGFLLGHAIGFLDELYGYLVFLKRLGYLNKSKVDASKVICFRDIQVTEDELRYGCGFVDLDPEKANFKRDTKREKSTVIQSLERARDQALSKNEPAYPHIYKSEKSGSTGDDASSFFITNQPVSLDLLQNDDIYNKDAIRKGKEVIDNKIFEEVIVMPPETCPLKISEKLISVSEFSVFSQPAFGKIAALNRIQSIVFDTAYKTNENLLICAPTGAGKTNVALMTVLRELEKNVNANGILELDKFKLVYVAPMKALASEVAENFSKKLSYLGVKVREYTGDMQLTKNELKETQMLVTTPEKWDVVTRKGTGENELASLVSLLILDEVHLLHDERGSVIEVLVSRTLRQVESTQKMVRIVGLSATLPNYLDVSRFLCVNPYTGLFFFDASFRPVPLTQHFIGVKKKLEMHAVSEMNQICFERMVEHLQQGFQVLIFVHSRNETVKTAEAMLARATVEGALPLLTQKAIGAGDFALNQRKVLRSQNPSVKTLGMSGIGIHNAGMLRQDRNLMESLFMSGFLSVLVCTATLAWGVNLPAHAVIIKGTNVYDTTKGGFRDLSVLDIAQIFGRAGRPQFETHGVGYLITTHNKLYKYITLMSQATPIESNFSRDLANHLNAEICLGTVTNVDEALQWLGYSYFKIRLMKNPTAYGLPYHQLINDGGDYPFILSEIRNATRKLVQCRMIRFDSQSGVFHTTDLGRIASFFYIKPDTIQFFNEKFHETMSPGQVLDMVSEFPEFSGIQVRPNELDELESLFARKKIHIDAKKEMFKVSVSTAGANFTRGQAGKGSNDLAAEATKKEETSNEMPTKIKINILFQAYIGCLSVDGFSLVSDMNYIAQNMARILRGLFELTLKKNMVISETFLQLAMSCERRIWYTDHPLKQFFGLSTTETLSSDEPAIDDGIAHVHTQKGTSGASGNGLSERKGKLNQPTSQKLMNLELYKKLDRLPKDIQDLKECSETDVFGLVRSKALVPMFQSCVKSFPLLKIDIHLKPVSSTILQIALELRSNFKWIDSIHHTMETFWLWIEDTNGVRILQHEYFILYKRNIHEVHPLLFTLPISDPPPSQYILRVLSDRWLGSNYTIPISFKHVILPLSKEGSNHTDLLELDPLPKSALSSIPFESLYKFSHFNALQTQYFHTLLHTDNNVLLGAPTGSGKTTAAELALFRLFNQHPNQKAVYIAPLKALVKERLKSWQAHLGPLCNKKIVELTGDFTPDIKSINQADIIISTPEKWDGITRLWQQRDYVKKIGLLIFDEIHMLGEERGPIIEVIVCRMNYIKKILNQPIRMVGLSTALANAEDMASWLGISKQPTFTSSAETSGMRSIQSNSLALDLANSGTGLFNFRPSVRPVPLELHIDSFSGKHYCPRMASMNKPAYHAIKMYSEGKPVLIFVASRRQTRLTAFDLIKLSNQDKMANGELISSDPLQQNFEDSDEYTKMRNLGEVVPEHLSEQELAALLEGLSSEPVFDGNPGQNSPSVSFGHGQFLKISLKEMETVVAHVRDEHLKYVLMFGIGMHHAGLVESDRKIVEELFAHRKIQILVATSTLAWGVNLPARMVIVKGTEYFDGKSKKYVDFPVTDVLQMVGRAGRPQFDDKATATVFVQDTKKEFYKKFLYNPFPVESRLRDAMHEHINAEIASGAINSMHAAISFITWTYFYLRLKINPTFYQLQDTTPEGMSRYISSMLERVLIDLERANCIVLTDSFLTFKPTTFGKICSFYYLKYKTLGLFSRAIDAKMSFKDVLALVCNAYEFDELPVRHNEDLTNEKFAGLLPIRLEAGDFFEKTKAGAVTFIDKADDNKKQGLPQEWKELSSDTYERSKRLDFLSPNLKTHLLLQAHISRCDPLPVTDYITDTKSVLEQFTRVVQAFIDVAAFLGFAQTVLSAIELLQAVSMRTLPMESVLTAGLDLNKEDHIYLNKTIRVSALLGKPVDAIKAELDNRLGKLMKTYEQTDPKGDRSSRTLIEKFAHKISGLTKITMKATCTTMEASNDKLTSSTRKSIKVTFEGSSPSQTNKALATDAPIDAFFVIRKAKTNEMLAIKRVSVHLSSSGSGGGGGGGNNNKRGRNCMHSIEFKVQAMKFDVCEPIEFHVKFPSLSYLDQVFHF